MEFDANVKRESTSPLKGTADIKFSYPGREMQLTTSIDEPDQNSFTHNMLFQWQTGRRIRLGLMLVLLKVSQCNNKIQIISEKVLYCAWQFWEKILSEGLKFHFSFCHICNNAHCFSLYYLYFCVHILDVYLFEPAM